MVSLRIALRYLFSKKSHNAVNVISIISMAGVAVATIAIVCVLSVFNGFSDLAYSRMSRIDPQVKVVPTHGKIIEQADSLADVISAISQVRRAAATIEEQALAIYEQRQMPVTMKGVPDDYSSITDISSTIIDGQFILTDTEHDYAVLSVGPAINLGANLSYFDVLALYVPRRIGRINPANPMAAFCCDSLIVSGVYQVNENDRDASMVVVPISVARDLLEYTTQASAIEIALADGIDDKDAIKAIQAQVGPDYRVMNRLEQEQQSFRMIAIEKWITFVMLSFILVIASFNVISTLSMLIIEKSDNMATLRALGAAPSLIRSIFVCEGWLISLVGGVAGILLGVALCLAQQWGGFIKLAGDPSKLSVTSYPVRVDLGDLTLVFLLIIVVGLVIGAITSCFVPKAYKR